MSFSEFLLAVGENGLYETFKAQDYELINAYAGKYVDLLKKYYYVGGMPEVVQTYIDSDDLYEVREIKNNLLTYWSGIQFRHNWRRKTESSCTVRCAKEHGLKILSLQYSG